MGTDCYLFSGGDFHRLDRWYVFEDFFNSGEFMPAEQAKQNLEALKKGEAKSSFLNYIESSEEIDEESKKKTRGYHDHWWKAALNLIEGNQDRFVVFYAEQDLPEAYFSK